MHICMYIVHVQYVAILLMLCILYYAYQLQSVSVSACNFVFFNVITADFPIIVGMIILALACLSSFISLGNKYW